MRHAIVVLSGVLLAAQPFPDPKIDTPASHGRATAVFAGGCFWGVEAVFHHVKGVESAVSGYAGGEANTAHYEIVSDGRSGHAESVLITFDPGTVSYGQLLKIFFSVAHDPTELNRQGPDYGTQYRSAIFYSGDDQRRIAEAYIQQLDQAKVFRRKIVTQVVPLKAFYPAEDYHQDYIQHNPSNPYVVINDLPKLDRLKKLYSNLVKP